MSAGDRDTLTDTAQLLIDHQINLLNSRGVECLCGWYLASDPTDTYEGQVAERFYWQHLAEVVAARVRAARAQELRDAADGIQALHPGEVKNSVLWLRERASFIDGTGHIDLDHIESSQNG